MLVIHIALYFYYHPLLKIILYPKKIYRYAYVKVKIIANINKITNYNIWLLRKIILFLILNYYQNTNCLFY